MKIRQEASQRALPYIVRSAERVGPGPGRALVRHESDHAKSFRPKRIQSYQKNLITPLIIQLQSRSLPHKYVINYPLI